MNDDNREQLWQAYLDGELSACEASQFESTLTEAEHRRLASEMRFDRALDDRLREGGDCPDEVWARTRERIAPQAGAAARLRKRRVIFAGAAIAAAALAVFVLPKMYPSGLNEIVGHDIIHAAASVDDLADASETDPGMQSVQRYLAAKGIPVKLVEDETILGPVPGHRPIQILGARQVRVAGTLVTEILIDCCDRPITLALAPRGTWAAGILESQARQPGQVEAARKIGGYTAAVVGRHPAKRLLDLFGERAV